MRRIVATSLALLALSACGSERNPPQGPIDPKGTDPDAGTGGTAGTASEAGGGPSGGGAGASDVGAPDAGVTPGDAGSSEPQSGDLADAGCTGSRAFHAATGAFVYPTPSGLAAALNASVYATAPFSLVVAYDPRASTAAASYTLGDAAGEHAFPAGLIPDFVSVEVQPGGFDAGLTQQRGWLLLDTADGPLELPVEHLTWSVSVREQCTRAAIVLSATVPGANADLVADLTGSSEQDAGTDRQGVAAATQLRGVFEAELVDFDFGSLP